VSDPPDAYKTLQVDHEAEDEVIVAAYRRLARKYHPDVAPGAEAAARMAAINAAFALIGSPTKRAAYDLDRRRAGTGPASAPANANPSRTSATTHTTTGQGSPTPPPAASGAGAAGSGSGSRPSAPPPPKPREPEHVSRDWTSGRSSVGGGYEPSMRTSDGMGAAGPPPGHPSGSVLTFGRYAGWSLGEIARADLEFVEWLDRMPIGRPYRDEIDAILRRTGRRRSAPAEATDRRGLFRRR
jgi:curved DNA-binding protein CbpA